MCSMDWWPWLRDGTAKIKTYVYTVPEGAEDGAPGVLDAAGSLAGAAGDSAKNLKTNLFFTFLSILGIFALNFEKSEGKIRKK